MRYYTRFLLVGAASGFFCVFNYAKNGMAQTLADIVMLFGFSSADCQLNQIMEGTYWYMPLFLFRSFTGLTSTGIFCSASIYFFSRCCSPDEMVPKRSAHAVPVCCRLPVGGACRRGRGGAPVRTGHARRRVPAAALALPGHPFAVPACHGIALSTSCLCCLPVTWVSSSWKALPFLYRRLLHDGGAVYIGSAQGDSAGACME